MKKNNTSGINCCWFAGWLRRGKTPKCSSDDAKIWSGILQERQSKGMKLDKDVRISVEMSEQLAIIRSGCLSVRC